MPKRCCGVDARLRRGAVAVALLGASGAQGAAVDACATRLGDAPTAARQVTAGENAVVAFAPSRWPLPVGQPLSLTIAVCPAGKLSAVDADMPAHRHGMNYRPSLRALGNGLWIADGLLLHMPGRWRFAFDIERDGRRERLTRELEVP